jgi:UDP-glucose:(heptosyl)LPS alpha-1,3-glucosyltransferase
LATYHATIKRWGLHDRVLFLPPRQDVEFYYAAADAYVGPSPEDAFSLPPLEGIAYGLPVIVSCHSGVSEIITHGVDGFILKDPQDAEELARLIRFLYENSDLRHRWVKTPLKLPNNTHGKSILRRCMRLFCLRQRTKRGHG